jgi:hypothetical protein
MSYVQSNVEKVLGIIPEHELPSYGFEELEGMTLRGFAESVINPGHLVLDMYRGDAQAVMYGYYAGYATAGAMFLQLGLTGTVSEGMLAGIAKGFKRAPTTILAIEAGQMILDIERMTAGKPPKSLTYRGIQEGVFYLTRSKKTGKDIRSFKFMERN